MCDTLVALKTVTAEQETIFAKNSDRPPNEAQYLDWHPAEIHADGEEVQCTYLSIPKGRQTYAVLLSRPFWMWGAEMGVNEHGLVIGNEAVYTKKSPNKVPALLGMDMQRLALERAKTPQEAIQVITQLLEAYGQGGDCSNGEKMYYHNSFLLANASEAWVLETVDKDWAAHKVQDVYSISNVLTLDHPWNSPADADSDLEFEQRLVEPQEGVDLSREYSDFLYTTFSNARQRRQNTMNHLKRKKLSVLEMMAALRDHQGHDGPDDNLLKNDVCMHAGFGPVRISQSVASMVVVMNKSPVVFATGTSAPCTSVFKPFWADIPLPNMAPNPTNQYDPQTLFWQHERLHREVMKNYPARIQVYQAERDEMEERFVNGAKTLKDAPQDERSAYAASCLKEAAEAESRWLEDVRKVPTNGSLLQRLHDIGWHKYNRKANLIE